MKTRTGRAHYLEVVKEMSHIKDMPPVFLLPTIAEWVLACEIRRSKSRNINGFVTRQMREYLIKLYCSINEIKSQKENSEAGKLRKQMDEMRNKMEILQEENTNLKKELELIKSRIALPPVNIPSRSKEPTSSREKESRKEKMKENKEG